MLVEKTPKKDDVVTVKLTSGEELVATLVEDGPMHLKLSRPVVLTMGQNGLGMVPYLFTVDLDTVVRMTKINVTVLEVTEEEAAKQYRAAVDSTKLKDVAEKIKEQAGKPEAAAEDK